MANELTISGDPVTVTPGAGQVFVTPGSQGLTQGQLIIFVDINDPPVANAGADQNIGIQQPFTLDGSTSTDPESLPLT